MWPCVSTVPCRCRRNTLRTERSSSTSPMKPTTLYNYLQLGNKFIELGSLIGGKSHQILVQVGRLVAFYARENGQGMAFPPPPSDMPSAGSVAVALTATPAADPAS